jgi:hypothetical protein
MVTKSPFPGMDPYLEQHWGDIHHRLVMYACDQLQGKLPGALRARVEERVFVESEDGWRRNVFPDVRILHRDKGRGAAASEPAVAEADEGGVAVAEPLVVILPSESITEGFIEIRDGANGNRVVTVIEVLSLANKAGAKGTEEYARKQREVIRSDSSLVEIDLLRQGRRVTSVPLSQVPPSHQSAYHACVHRAWRGDEHEVYPIHLRQRLPAIPIPLRKSDPDARLNLQALVEQAYRLGRYDDIDYSQPPVPALDEDDARWARDVVAAAASKK